VTNPLLLIVAALVITGLGELAALLGILFRYAIPRSPKIFHVLLFVPMVSASLSCFVLAWIALTGEQQAAGVDEKRSAWSSSLPRARFTGFWFRMRSITIFVAADAPCRASSGGSL